MNKYIISIIIIIVISGCSSNKFDVGHKLFLEKNYVSAIEQFDYSIEKDSNGAIVTKAELERSESYYQLALLAYEKENWLLASRLLFLANSNQADEILDNCYYALSSEAFEENDTETTLSYYQKIIDYLTESELIPEIYYRRIKILLNNEKKIEAITDFTSLWKKYHDNEFTQKARPLIDAIIPQQLDILTERRDNEAPQEVLAQLFIFSQYSQNHLPRINTEIAKTYIMLADNEIANLNYSAGYDFFLQSYQYDENLKEQTKNKIGNICQGFIFEGDKLFDNFNFDDAILKYQKCYEIEPNNAAASKKIITANKRKLESIHADELFLVAKELENSKNYAQALIKYRESKKLVNNARIREKIFIMKNLIRAKKEPRVFARDIILGYNKGKLAEKIYAVEESMITKHGSSFVEVSGWKVLFSSSKHSYDVRYDILSPTENYYFVWRVNLKNQKISALNKISEDLIK